MHFQREYGIGRLINTAHLPVGFLTTDVTFPNLMHILALNPPLDLEEGRQLLKSEEHESVCISHAEMLEMILAQSPDRFDLVILYGEVNDPLLAGLTIKLKAQYPHLMFALRSLNRMNQDTSVETPGRN